MKSQTVRLIDVLILGPFMIWAGMQLREPWAKATMIAAGGATIAYNWQNLQKGKITPHVHTPDCPGGYAITSTGCSPSISNGVSHVS